MLLSALVCPAVAVQGFVISDLAGHPRDLVAPPSGARLILGNLAVASGQVLALTENGHTGAICDYDVSSRQATTLVTVPYDVDICAMAANSTHVFWVQSSTPGGPCMDVWTMALGGGAPRLIYCGSDDTLSPILLATDSMVFWMQAGFHTLDPSEL